MGHIEKAQCRPDKIEGLIIQKVDKMVEECIEELQEREKKKLNLITSNLP